MKTYKKFFKLILVSKLLIIFAYLVNKIIFFTATLKEILFNQNQLTYNWRFGKIHYTKQGSGSPLLLIHDLNCTSSSFEWNNTVVNLSQKYTVYTIDLIGCGNSDKPKFVYTNFLYVQLLSDFIKNIIKQKTNVVGTGNISSVLIMLCNFDKQLINKVVLINPESTYDLKQFPQFKHKICKHITMYPIIGTSIYNFCVSKYYISHTMKNDYFYNPSNIRRKYINAYYEASHLGGSSSKYLFSSMINHFTKINITHALEKINNDILIIQGEFVSNNKSILRQYLTYNDSISSTIINDTKHLPQLEKPSEVINAIFNFI